MCYNIVMTKFTHKGYNNMNTSNIKKLKTTKSDRDPSSFDYLLPSLEGLYCKECVNSSYRNNKPCKVNSMSAGSYYIDSCGVVYKVTGFPFNKPVVVQLSHNFRGVWQHTDKVFEISKTYLGIEIDPVLINFNGKQKPSVDVYSDNEFKTLFVNTFGVFFPQFTYKRGPLYGTLDIIKFDEFLVEKYGDYTKENGESMRMLLERLVDKKFADTIGEY
jgi:hypothetical protein